MRLSLALTTFNNLCASIYYIRIKIVILYISIESKLKKFYINIPFFWIDYSHWSQICLFESARFQFIPIIIIKMKEETQSETILIWELLVELVFHSILNRSLIGINIGIFINLKLMEFCIQCSLRMPYVSLSRLQGIKANENNMRHETWDDAALCVLALSYIRQTRQQHAKLYTSIMQSLRRKENAANMGNRACARRTAVDWAERNLRQSCRYQYVVAICCCLFLLAWAATTTTSKQIITITNVHKHTDTHAHTHTQIHAAT